MPSFSGDEGSWQWRHLSLGGVCSVLCSITNVSSSTWALFVSSCSGIHFGGYLFQGVLGTEANHDKALLRRTRQYMQKPNAVPSGYLPSKPLRLYATSLTTKMTGNDVRYKNALSFFPSYVLITPARKGKKNTSRCRYPRTQLWRFR